MKLARLIFVIPLYIDWRRQFHGWLLAEAAVPIAIITPLLRDDCDFVARMNLRHFGLLTCQFDLEIEHRIIVLTKIIGV
jgi:hypothetical protein